MITPPPQTQDTELVLQYGTRNREIIILLHGELRVKRNCDKRNAMAAEDNG